MTNDVSEQGTTTCDAAVETVAAAAETTTETAAAETTTETTTETAAETAAETVATKTAAASTTKKRVARPRKAAIDAPKDATKPTRTRKKAVATAATDQVAALPKFVFPSTFPYAADFEAYAQPQCSKIALLSDILNKLTKFTAMGRADQVRIIKEIERSCYDEAVRQITNIDMEPDWDNIMFINTYNYICGNLFQNIDPTSIINSDYLANKILDGKINLQRIGGSSSEELCPEKSREIRKKIEIRAGVKYSIKSSTMYRCGKCKRNECTLERMHTRGLDELTNYRATCIFCKHTWMI